MPVILWQRGKSGNNLGVDKACQSLRTQTLGPVRIHSRNREFQVSALHVIRKRHWMLRQVFEQMVNYGANGTDRYVATTGVVA